MCLPLLAQLPAALGRPLPSFLAFLSNSGDGCKNMEGEGSSGLGTFILIRQSKTGWAAFQILPALVY